MALPDRPRASAEPPQPKYTPPPLTPAFCFHPRLLRDFLRLSRSNIDDAIATHLNALHTPSESQFPNTASPSPSSRTRTPIPTSRCARFVTTTLFPAWQARSDALNYCAAVAASPDPDDPDAVARELELQDAEQRVVDERLDPYSARFFPKEPRTDRLAQLVGNERRVEGIVRLRSWEVVAERCEGAAEWREGMERVGRRGRERGDQSPVV